MGFSPRDQKILHDLGKARKIFQDLKELLDFYEKLFRSQFTFKSRLRAPGWAERWAAKEVNLGNLAIGLAQISFEELDMQSSPILDLYQEIVRLLIPYVGSSEGLETEPPPEKIVEWAQEIFLSRGPLLAPEAAKDPVRTATGFVLAPYLQLACDLILPRIPSDLWHREYCPICGGRPAIAALISDSSPRTLLCPRCYGEWSFGRIGCPFCKSTEGQTYYAGEEGRYRLYVCGVCNRYLKTVDERQPGMRWSLPVECLLTVSMDIAAQEEGFIP